MHSLLPAYVELHALSNFSFQRGASHPEELAERAHALGYTALAVTDECSVAGVVRAHVAAKALGLKFLPGAEFRVHTGPGAACRGRRGGRGRDGRAGADRQGRVRRGVAFTVRSRFRRAS